MTGSTRILVTGATGYVGGRLVPMLVESGHRVRVLARTPDKLRDVPWARDVEVVRGDLDDADTAGRLRRPPQPHGPGLALVDEPDGHDAILANDAVRFPLGILDRGRGHLALEIDR